MKIHTLSATGNIEISSSGRLEVDEVKVLEELAKHFRTDEGKYQSIEFAGSIEITITDYTEPLEIDEITTTDYTKPLETEEKEC